MEPSKQSLCIDLYELTMAAAYHLLGMAELPSCFELFVRRLPPNRGFLISSGQAEVIKFLQNLRFTIEDCRFLQSLPIFQSVHKSFFEWLANLKFSGEVDAIPEGTVVFADEPIIRVIAPLGVAQLLETYLLSIINFSTLISTKAARIKIAAQGRPFVDFGTRRAHGPEAGFLAARAAFIGGADGTSNVLAGREYGIPVSGTMAHSFIQAIGHEESAFKEFLSIFGPHTILLIDTFDTIKAASLAAKIPGISGVRLDSGDLSKLCKNVREILDQAGRADVKIFLSGDLNEYKILDLISKGAFVDAFGVGTELATSFDAPALNGVYKIAAICRDGIHWRGVIKLSEDKATWPGLKQVWRSSSAEGIVIGDLLELEGVVPQDSCAKPLLVPAWRKNAPVGEQENLEAMKNRASIQIASLPDGVKKLIDPEPYPVNISLHIRQLAQSIKEEILT